MKLSDFLSWLPALAPAILMFPMAVRAELLPEPAAPPLGQRQTPYSMVYYYLTEDEAQTRRQLQTLHDLGTTQTLALVYWWKAETLGGDYWKKEYRPEQIGEHCYRAMDNYVKISHELGMKPCFRLGSFREFEGLWHPADKSGSVENYAAWVKKLAARYRGQIDHYTIGDEENRGGPGGWSGAPEEYMNKMLIPLATAIRAGDPEAKISTCATSSSPDTPWLLKLVELGLPKYADGVACNLWHTRIEDCWEIEDLMKRMRAVWPEARFYGNGVGYAVNHGEHDLQQAGIVAQSMFTLWDIGWDDAPYYLYHFSLTADTKENYGIVSLPNKDSPGVFTDAYRAYQTIAQTFYDRPKLKSPGFKISLRQAQVLKAADGSQIRLAPPDVVLRSYIRDDRLLIIYLACRNFRYPSDGTWDILIESDQWGGPQQVPLLDYTKRQDLPSRPGEGGGLVVPGVHAGLQPAIIVLRKVKR